MCFMNQCQQKIFFLWNSNLNYVPELCTWFLFAVVCFLVCSSIADTGHSLPHVHCSLVRLIWLFCRPALQVHTTFLLSLILFLLMLSLLSILCQFFLKALCKMFSCCSFSSQLLAGQILLISSVPIHCVVPDRVSDCVRIGLSYCFLK